MIHEALTREIIAAAIEVHRGLGPGLLESAYQTCLAYEFTLRNIGYLREYSVPVMYKGICLECAFRLDFWVENAVIVELKSVEQLLPIHEAQLLTYMRIVPAKIGLLINFNVPLLKNGIKRLIL